MSSTNTTEFYGLTQYVGSDKPSFTDNNEAFRALDAALHGAVAGVEDASDAITTLTGRVGDVEDAVTGLSGTVGTQGDAITVLQNKEISQDRDIADVKAAALDMICAYNEEAAQSVHAYAIGDFFRYNDVLYKASAVINIGDTIIPNTNCVATNVTAQLLNDVDKIGNLASLTTTDKTSAVAAINEVNNDLTANTMGTEVNLNSYTSPDAPYTCPSDGYIVQTVGGSVNTAIETKINNALVITLKGNGSETVHNAVFVRKGMKIHNNSATVDSNRICSFIPLS